MVLDNILQQCQLPCSQSSIVLKTGVREHELKNQLSVR